MRFFLIDRITLWQVGSCAEAIKNIALSEDFFDDHFPRRPIMPGVLILEGMAQLAGLLLEASLAHRFGQDAKCILTILEKTKFREFVRPGDSLTYHAEVLSFNETAGKVHVQATLAGKLITSTDMVFAFKRIDDPKLNEKRQALLNVWLHGCGEPTDA
jgi:3-hydroxyacyl-[acyl-carrier-protein] dehydratase